MFINMMQIDKRFKEEKIKINYCLRNPFKEFSKHENIKQCILFVETLTIFRK